LRLRVGADDLVSKMWLKLLQAADRSGSPHLVPRWLKHALRQSFCEAIREVRAQMRNPGRECPLPGSGAAGDRADAIGDVGAPHTTPSEAAIRNERTLRILEVLGEMARSPRRSHRLAAEAIHLRHYAVPPVEKNNDLAARMGISPGRASTLYYAGLTYLLRVLNEQSGTPVPATS
jgi:DNA-directed RNA polymerase specialized sigma24 family protein